MLPLFKQIANKRCFYLLSTQIRPRRGELVWTGVEQSYTVLYYNLRLLGSAWGAGKVNVEVYCMWRTKFWNSICALISTLLHRIWYMLGEGEHKVGSDATATTSNDDHSPEIESFIQHKKEIQWECNWIGVMSGRARKVWSIYTKAIWLGTYTAQSINADLA